MKILKNLKHIFAVSVISLSLIGSSLFVFGDEFTDAMNGFFVYRTTGDVWQDMFHKHTPTPSSDIIIIKIDEPSLNELQAKNNLTMLGIPKSIYTTLIQKLENVNVRGIAFDILFQNADADERLFAEMLTKYPNIVIGAQYHADLCQIEYGNIYTALSQTVASKYPKYPSASDCLALLRNIIVTEDIETRYRSMLVDIDDVSTLTTENILNIFCTYTSNAIFDCPGLPRSLYKSVGWGMIDIDSSYERPLFADISQQPYISWKAGTGGNIDIASTRLETLPLALYSRVHTGVQLSPRDIPTYTKTHTELSNNREYTISTVLQPYFGPPTSTYQQISLIDAYDMSILDLTATFAGKYVLIGESGTHINDTKTSPVTNTAMAGVEMHAHFLDGLLQNKMISRLSVNQMAIAILLLTLMSTVLYFTVPKYLSPILAIVMMIAILFVSRYVYDIQRVLVDVFYLFLAGGIITYPVTYIYRFFVVEREKRELQNNFGHYIDPHVVEEIAAKGVEIQLGGEKKILSVLFSDIAGFTTISESLDPKDLFYLMTAYLSNMTDILIGHGGTLDKYIGDAVMGFFGAPLSYTDHAIRAADTAILMRQRLPEFNADIVKHGMKPIDFRVGIATGEVMVGNIGSHDRFNYTVLGDTVNLASRLEGTGKEYDVHIIVPESTKQALGPLYLTRELDTIAVKGKTEGVKIYELIGYSKDYPERLIYINYEKALALYRAQQYREAGKLWQTLAEKDPPSRVMMYRCLEILKGHITVEDGIYQMTHK